MRANQLRLWFASFAYVLMSALRRIGLANTRLADATCGTIRLKLLKIGALARGALNCRLTQSSGYRAAALLIVVRTVLPRTTPCRPIIRISRAAEQRPATLHTAPGLVGQPLCGSAEAELNSGDTQIWAAPPSTKSSIPLT